MTLRFDFGDDPYKPAGCFDEMPPQQACAPAVCCPCDSLCPAKVEKRKYITIKPDTSETCFTIGHAGCDPTVVAAFRECIELRIRKRGECPVLLTMRPIRAKLDGTACFEWGVNWWNLTDNWYEADVYVNGVSCLTIGLHQVGCDLALLRYSMAIDDGCPTSCAPTCTTPIVEDPVVYQPAESCETATC